MRASVLLGAVLAGARPEQEECLARFGEALGLAFQVVDDILDVEGETAELGKQTRKDEAAGKATYPAVAGMEASWVRADEMVEKAERALDDLHGLDTSELREIARFVLARRI
jgi:geranylgeranyl diphosphate synthase type II